MANTLFVVDDSATMRKVFELTFAGEEVTVVTHDGSDGAVARIREVRPQAAIVDVALGQGATGYDLVRSIRAEASLGPIPIYLLYSEHSPLDEPAARACGAAGAIVKPFDSQVLIDKVRQALSQARPAAGATTGNMTAPFGNPQPGPAIASAGGPPATTPTPTPTPKASDAPSTGVARPAGFAAGTRPATVTNPAQRNAPVPAPNPVRPPPPLPSGGRSPTAAVLAKASDRPLERSPAFSEGDSAVVEGGVARASDPVPARGIATVHDKATAPVMAPAIETAFQSAARAVEGQASALGLTPAQVEAISALTRDVVERVVWEVVPQLAETIIREELKRLTAD